MVSIINKALCKSLSFFLPIFNGKGAIHIVDQNNALFFLFFSFQQYSQKK